MVCSRCNMGRKPAAITQRQLVCVSTREVASGDWLGGPCCACRAKASRSLERPLPSRCCRSQWRRLAAPPITQRLIGMRCSPKSLAIRRRPRNRTTGGTSRRSVMQSQGAQMQQMPAVDGINAKIAGYGGGENGSNGFYGAVGSLSIPLAQQWGLQLDGDLGSDSGIGFHGRAAHLFWRDPSIALLGAYVFY